MAMTSIAPSLPPSTNPVLALPSHGRWSLGPPYNTGRAIHDLLTVPPKEGFTRNLFANLQEIGSKEGFIVTPLLPTQNRTALSCQVAQNAMHPIRDPKVRAHDGAILQPPCSESLLSDSKTSRLGALDRTMLRTRFLGSSAASRTQHPAFKNTGIGSVAQQRLYQLSPDGLDEPLRDTRCYLEGGNIFYANGTYFVGEDLITATHSYLRESGWFVCDRPIRSHKDIIAFNKANPQRNSAALLDEHLIMKKYGDRLNRQFLNGKIPEIIAQFANEITIALNDEEVLFTLQEMASMKLISREEISKNKEHGRAIAVNYLAQRAFVRREIFTTDLKVQANRIIEIPQLAYHIDCAMMLGPNQTVFLQDYARGVMLLRKIEKDNPDLPEIDREKLRLFIQEAEQLEVDLRPLIDRATEKITAAGFRVIPAPGAFYGPATATTSNPQNPSHYAFESVNFLNAVTGYSTVDRQFYCILSGADIGDRLGQLLMSAYADFVHEHLPNTRVHFVGENPEQPGDFSETREWGKHLLGPHCLTFERGAYDHPDCR